MRGQITTENQGKTLKFKGNVNLDDFSKALGYFNKLFIIFAGREATYTEFTKWIEDNEFAEVEVKK